MDGGMERFVLSAVTELGIDVFLKATAILSVAMLLVLASRRASSSLRHAIWSAAFVILIAIPVASGVFPSWRLDRFTLPPREIESRTPALIVPANTAASPAATPSAVTDPASKPPVEAAQTISVTSVLVAAALGLWLCVAAVILVRLLIHVLRVGRITARATPNDCEEIRALAHSLKKSLGINDYVRVVVSDEVAMPFAWGVMDPAIVFPSGARDWPVDRKRSVLLHELAHIARRDYLVHLVVEIVRALYWPNPLVWLAARLKAEERERACDDFAIRQGTPSREYATHLLQVARLQLEPCVPVGAVTMTAKTGLSQRIQYVMDENRDRSPVHGSRMIGAAFVVGFIALLVGTFEVTASKWPIPTVDELVVDLRESDDPLTRRRAAWWLGEHESRAGVDPLIEGLRDESAEVRIASAWALGEIKDEKAIDPLIATLERDDNALVREMAALALGEIENPSAVDPLVEALKDDEDLRLAVVWALGEIENNGSRRAGRARDDAINEIERRPWDNEQVWTGNVSEFRSTSEDLQALLDDLRNDDAATRREGALNLGFLGIRKRYESTAEVERAVDALLETLSDPAPEVRAASVWSLDEINPSRSAR